jgi:iron(III) transport system permease protein
MEERVSVQDVPATGPAGRRIVRLARPGSQTLVVVAIVAVVGYLVLLPLGYLAWRAFVRDGAFTLSVFADAYDQYDLGSMIANSLVFAGASTVIALPVGAILAYLVARTDLPARTLWFALAIAPLVIPLVLYTIAWIFLASPRSGALNAALGEGTVNVFGLAGMAVVQGLHLVPIVFLLMYAGFRRMDPAFEESALACGVPLPTVFRKITLRLAVPALSAALLISLISALEDFIVPALVGIPGGVWVLTSRIWDSLSRYPFDLDQAAAWSVTLLVVVSIGVFLHSRLTRRTRRYQTVTPKGFRPRTTPLGRWRWPALAFCAVYGFVAVALPFLVLLYVSLQPFYAPPTLERLGNPTGRNYAALFQDGDVLHALKNSVLLAVGAATLTMALMAVASWVTVRTKMRARWLIDNLAFLPIAVPGLVLGVALLFVYLRMPVGVYGTIWILLIAYVTRYLPYGMRYASVSMGQVGRDLEEVAHVSGAGWVQTFRRVLLPLVAPGLLAGWLTIVIFAVRELTSSIVVYSPGNEVLAITIWNQFESGEFSELAALGVIMIAALSLLSVVAYRLGRKIGFGA